MASAREGAAKVIIKLLRWGRKSLIITLCFPALLRDWPCLRWRHLTLRLPLLSPFPRWPFRMQSIDVPFGFEGRQIRNGEGGRRCG